MAVCVSSWGMKSDGGHDHRSLRASPATASEKHDYCCGDHVQTQATVAVRPPQKFGAA